MRLSHYILALVCLFAPFAGAQNQTVYATNVTDASNNTLASGQVRFTPTVCSAPLSGFHKGGGGQATGNPVYVNVTNGAFSVSLPDVNLTNPQNLGFDVTITDDTGTQLLDYTCVQPSMTAQYASQWCSSSLNGCDFDNYIPNTPKVPAVTTGQAINNYYNSQLLVDISSYPGADLGAKLIAADAAYAGKPAIFGITQSGTLSTLPTLGPKHGLWITAPTLNFATYIIPTQDNVIGCAPGVQITNSQSSGPSGLNEVGLNAFFYVPSTASEAERVRISGCSFNGYGMHSGFIFASFGPTQDISITDNDASYGSLYFQHAAGPGNPSLRLTVTGNTARWPLQSVDCNNQPIQTPTENCTAFGVISFGALQHAVISHNHFSNVYYGVDLFAENSKGQDGEQGAVPSDALAAGLSDDLLEGNECEHTHACQWTSLSARVAMVGDIAHICEDVCFDFETGIDNSVTGSTAVGAGYAGFAQEFGGVRNSFTGNTGIGGIMFGNTSATYGSLYNANTYYTDSGVGIFLYRQSADDGTQVTNNTVTDGLLAYANYIGTDFVQGNVFRFDAAIPTSNVGSPTGAGCGLTLGNINDNITILSKGNTIITTVPQTQPALCMATSVSNVDVTYTSQNDTILGPWSTDVQVGASGTNPAYQPTFVLRGTQLASGNVTSSSGHGIQPSVVCTGGHTGHSGALATLNVTGSTTAQVTCTN